MGLFHLGLCAWRAFKPEHQAGPVGERGTCSSREICPQGKGLPSKSSAAAVQSQLQASRPTVSPVLTASLCSLGLLWRPGAPPRG